MEPGRSVNGEGHVCDPFRRIGQTATIDPQFPWSFTPDGNRLAFYESSSKTSFDLWTVSIESDGAGLRAGKPEVFLQTPAVPFLLSRRAVDSLQFR
jgi:hypothetical protein